MNSQSAGLGKAPHGRRLPYLAAMAVLAVLALTAAWALSPQVARAHALLVRSDPPVDAQLLDPPTTVTTFFSEPLDSRLSSLKVLDGTGQEVDSGQTTFGPDPAQMSVAIAEELPPGFYSVVWETLSTVDGHLLKGSFPFTVLNPDGSQPTGPRLAGLETGVVSGGEPTWDVVTTKWLGLSAAVMLVGGLAFVAWVVRPASKELAGPWKQRAREAARRHLAWVAWPCLALLAVVGAAELVLQTRQLGGPGFVDDVLRTFWGQRWIQRQLVLGALVVALGASGWLWRAMPAGRQARRDRLSEAALWVALAGGLGYLVLVAMVSHGGSLPGSFWAVTADFVHLVAAAVWIGTLAQLALLLVWSRRHLPNPQRPVLLAAHLQRFSALAASSVALLLASGTVNALDHVPVPEAMLDTPYGRVLTAKLALMAVLLVVAGANALLLRPRLVREGAAAAERLGRRLSAMVGLEAGLALAVLLVAAVLVQYPTSRQERAAEANVQASAEAVIGFEDTQPAGDLQVNISVAPGVVGTNSFQVYLFPPPGGQVGEVQRVRLRFKPPDPSLGPAEAIAEEAGPNFYKAVGAFFTLPGTWELQVDIRRRQVDDVSALFRPEVAGTGAATSQGSRYDLPLVAGSWATVGAVGTLLAALLMAVWSAQWPRLPVPALRTLRVGRVTVGVFGLALLGGMLWLTPLTEEPTSGNPVKPSGDSIATGRSLYAQNCAQCHGENGRGDGPLAPTLEVPPADFAIHIPYHSDRFFFQVISAGLGTFMPPFGGQLTEEERWHLINFLEAEFGIDAQQSD